MQKFSKLKNNKSKYFFLLLLVLSSNLKGQNNTYLGKMQTISSLYTAQDINACDIDGDGDNDVITASFTSSKFIWIENIDGNGTFGNERIISNVNYVSSIFTCDVDNDGDIDILFTSENGTYFAWYENSDGLGTFIEQPIDASSIYNIVNVFGGDIDGDGDIDIIATGDNSIFWFENTDGEGNFGALKIISSDHSNSSIFVCDIDGDGDNDVLSSSNANNLIDWYENNDGNGSFSSSKVISNSAYNANFIHACDIDGDFDYDVILASDSKISLFKNIDGNGNFGAEEIISTLVDDAKDVYASDIDGDGDLDILSASFTDDKIAWYENVDGEGNFSIQKVITLSTDAAISVFACNINGDNKSDVLSSSWDGKVVWYENKEFNEILTKPNGGEVWNIGSMKDITWITGQATNLKIEYSEDNGTSYHTVVENTPAQTGCYAWSIPIVASDQCIVKISPSTADYVSDISNETFTIYLDANITNPNGGEKWFVDSVEDITWVSSNLDNVGIEFSIDNGENYNIITSSINASLGIYEWTVPDKISEECVIRLFPSGYPAINDTSDDTFTICNKLRIQSPLDGAEIQYGDIIPILVDANTIFPISITQVNFFINDVLVGTDLEFPYFCDWNTIGSTLGVNIVKAIMIDSENNIFEDEIIVSLLDFNYIETNENLNDVIIFPNPNFGIFSIVFDESSDLTNTTVQVYDLAGSFIKNIELKSKKDKIDLTGIDKGVFLLKIIHCNNILYKKLIIN